MYSRKTALLHLFIIAGCVLLADALPNLNKDWFVHESGKYSSSGLISLGLLVGLFKQWQPARNLLLAWLVLNLVFAHFIIYIGFSSDNPIIGFCLASTLRLAAFGTLAFSSDLKNYGQTRLSSAPGPNS